MKWLALLLLCANTRLWLTVEMSQPVQARHEAAGLLPRAQQLQPQVLLPGAVSNGAAGAVAYFKGIR